VHVIRITPNGDESDKEVNFEEWYGDLYVEGDPQMEGLLRPNRSARHCFRSTTKGPGGGRNDSVEVAEATTNGALTAMEAAKRIADEEYQKIRKKNKREAMAALREAYKMRLAQAYKK